MTNRVSDMSLSKLGLNDVWWCVQTLIQHCQVVREMWEKIVELRPNYSTIRNA